MRAILIISALAVVASGRPEPPSGYQYQAPSSRYGAPSPSGPGGLDQGGFRSGGGAGFGGASASASASASAGYPGRSADQGIVVNKHVYVHVAPPDTEESHQPKARVHVPPPQKHYKIIFIKAPTPPTPTVPDIPPIQQDEEKTLVYVLVKKPEDQPEIQIPTAAPTEPSKPEVYFIRYKTQKEDSGVHGGIGGGAGAGAGGGAGAGPGQDFSQIDASLDDTVEVGAARQAGAGAAPQGGNGLSGAPQGGAASQAGAFSSAQSFSSGGASSRTSSGPSSQYGAPSARGPY